MNDLKCSSNLAYFTNDLIPYSGPNTFTGEDEAELHIHGGQAVINAVLAAIGRVPRTRLAEPGEFTRRSVSSSSD